MAEFKVGMFIEFISKGKCSINEEFVETWEIEEIDENGRVYMTCGDNKAGYLNYRFREANELSEWGESVHKKVGKFKRLKGTDEILKSYD